MVNKFTKLLEVEIGRNRLKESITKDLKNYINSKYPEFSEFLHIHVFSGTNVLLQNDMFKIDIYNHTNDKDIENLKMVCVSNASMPEDEEELLAYVRERTKNKKVFQEIARYIRDKLLRKAKIQVEENSKLEAGEAKNIVEIKKDIFDKIYVSKVNDEIDPDIFEIMRETFLNFGNWEDVFPVDEEGVYLISINESCNYENTDCDIEFTCKLLERETNG